MGRLYGIPLYAVITIQHLMALLFYTNFSHQQCEFTATFLRIYWNETDESLKCRHSQFHFWGKLLRETVECFGTAMEYVPERIFYHGISQSMLFESTSFHVYGPMSTTVEMSVALNFAQKGMVIDIINTKIAIPLFDCSFWSEFTNENERLFIGSLQYFIFETIHYLPLNENYEIFIRVIGILMGMIDGWPYQISAIKQKDFKTLSVLISDHINNKKSEKIPFYVHNLLKHIVQNVNKIHLNMFWFDGYMQWEKEYAEEYQMFGHLKLKPLFFIDEQVNYSKLCQIFDNKLQQIVIFHYTSGSVFNKSIHLNFSFLEEIVFGIRAINKNVALKSVFNEILIVNPFEDINQFIADNQALFAENGWKLKKTKYEDAKRRGAKSDNVLSITLL